MTVPSPAGRSTALPWRTAVVLWVLFASICTGLGYGALNRYDPTKTAALSDTRQYAELVVRDPGPVVRSHRSFRILVPYLARPVARLAEGRVGTWSPVFLGLLAVNAALVATAAVALAALAARLGLEPAVGMLAGLLLAVNHTVVNTHLVGMVDAGEMCAAVLLAAALLHGRWWALVPIGIGGALAKETFVVFSGVMAAVWWWMAWRRSPQALRAALWIVAMSSAAMGAVLLVRMAIAGAVTDPVAIAASFDREPWSAWRRFRYLLLNADLYYGLFWVLPLGLWSIRRVPRAWTAATVAAAGVALVLGDYALAGGGNVSRPIISLVGPPLSLAAAITLVRQPWLRRAEPSAPSAPT
jgi:hypothetical protein